MGSVDVIVDVCVVGVVVGVVDVIVDVCVVGVVVVVSIGAAVAVVECGSGCLCITFFGEE